MLPQSRDRHCCTPLIAIGGIPATYPHAPAGRHLANFRRMARPLRVYAPGLLHHVFARGNDKHCVFADDDDHRAFLELLGTTLSRFDVEAAGYCLLWNHYHLLLVPHGETAISRMMQQLNSTYCQRFNRRHGRVGHVLQGRFGLRIIEDGDYARTAFRYLALNPVAAGRTQRPEDWRWSSYRVALGLDATPDFLVLQHVWSAFGTSDLEIGRSLLAEFVDAGLSETFPNSLLHGSVGLCERMAPLLEPHQSNRDFTHEQRFAARLPLETILAGCSDRTSVENAAHAAFSRHGYTLAELGQALNRHPSTVCRWIQRVGARLPTAVAVARAGDAAARNKI
jgi:REP element-mobilizing transposase RayT